QLPAAASPSLLFLFIVNAFGIGPMHQGPTWFFYFDKKNSQYWAQDPKRVALYYVAPLLVGAISAYLAVTTPWLGLTVTTLWGVQHFVQQNLGIVLLYHNKNANEALPNRDLLSRSLWTPSIFFVSVFFYRQLFAGVESYWAMAAFAALALLALFDIARYLNNILKQVSAGASLNVPAFIFWLTSVLYFIPFVWPGQRVETAFLIPGTMHWCQYIGLNLILVRYKYQDEKRKFDIPFNAQALMAVLCFGSLGIYMATHAIRLDFSPNSFNFKFMLGLSVAMSNIHYFQDAFFWRFREQFQRDSIMPYLLQARQVDTASAKI
ncbi:MAG: hypothetical protein WCT03_05425, partial [Candidatus Obscuribacterales bacterium]